MQVTHMQVQATMCKQKLALLQIVLSNKAGLSSTGLAMV